MPTFALPPLPSLPSLGSLQALPSLPSLNGLSSLIDPGPSVFYPTKRAGRADRDRDRDRDREGKGSEATSGPYIGGPATTGRARAGSTGSRGTVGRPAALYDDSAAAGISDDGIARRGRTISMPMHQSTPSERARAVMRTRKSRADSVGSAKSWNSGAHWLQQRQRQQLQEEQQQRQMLGDAWKVVDNPLARMTTVTTGGRRGSACSALSALSHSYPNVDETSLAGESGVKGADDVDAEDNTPRPHRLLVSLHRSTPPSRFVPDRIHPPVRKQPMQAANTGELRSPSRARPLHRRALSAFPTPTRMGKVPFPPPAPPSALVNGMRPTPRRAYSGHAGHSGTGETMAGFAFPASPPQPQPQPPGRLYEHTRNWSVASLPTLAEGEHSHADDPGVLVGLEDAQGTHKSTASQQSRQVQVAAERTRRGSLSIALPHCHTRTYSTSSSSDASPTRRPVSRESSRSSGVPSLFRALSNSSADLDARRPTSPLSMCSMFGSSLDSDVSDLRALPVSRVSRRPMSRHSFSVPPPLSQHAPFPADPGEKGQVRPRMSPRGYTTGDLGRSARTRTYSNTSVRMGALGGVVLGKGQVGEASMSEVAVIATWSFPEPSGREDDGAVTSNQEESEAGDEDAAKGKVRPSMTLQERLVSLSKLDTTVQGQKRQQQGLEVCVDHAPGSPAGLVDDHSQRPQVKSISKAWRMPLWVDTQNMDGRPDAQSKDRPLIRVSSIVSDAPGYRARPAYLSHRHTHSSPTLLHPGYVSPRRTLASLDTGSGFGTGRDFERPHNRKRQLSRLREPAPLSGYRSDADRRSMGWEHDSSRPASRSSVDHVRSRRPHVSSISDVKDTEARAAHGNPSAHKMQAEEAHVKKGSWWSRRNSISGTIPQPTVQFSKSGSDGDQGQEIGLATASLSGLDLAGTQDLGRGKMREDSPESEEFIDFDDM